jgi:hypothetical protein
MRDPLAGLMCTRHPDRPARGYRGRDRRGFCRACAEHEFPGLELTPDGWQQQRRRPRTGQLELDPGCVGQMEFPVESMIGHHDDDQVDGVASVSAPFPTEGTDHVTQCLQNTGQASEVERACV